MMEIKYSLGRLCNARNPYVTLESIFKSKAS